MPDFAHIEVLADSSLATTSRRRVLLVLASAATLAACGGGSDKGNPTPTPHLNGPAWWGYGRDAQHTGQGAIATQPLSRIQWTTSVDLQPQYSKGDLLIHYGSPVVSASNSVIVPVKTGATNGFRIDAHAGAVGTLLWTTVSDYLLPSHDWTPSFGVTLTKKNRLYMPGSGGKLLWCDDADAGATTMQRAIFYGSGTYDAAKATFDNTVFINTPLTADADGNIFFGFTVTGANPAGLVSGLARIAADGSGSWVSARAASNDASVSKVVMNCAPACSGDFQTVYVAVNTAVVAGTRQSGYLLALDSTTLTTKAAVRLTDPVTGMPSWVDDDGTSSPTVAPNGEVFYGVLEANLPDHNSRGWLLHFDATLLQTRLPGSFGWDDTASIVPAAMVASYRGSSSYLLMTKYNNYGGKGSGDGLNRVALLDPSQSQNDFLSGIPVMKEVMTILSQTPDPQYAGGFKEWCINTAAIDPFTQSILVNNEDGYLYRWDMGTNQFTERIQLTSGVGEAYTPTVIGADGAVFAINNAALFSIGR